jgi:phosphatidylinositol glycan class F
MTYAAYSRYLLQTYAFSLHLAVLTIWPAVYTLGIPSLHSAGTFDRYRLTRLYCEFRYVRLRQC